MDAILTSGLSDEQVRSLVCRYLHRHHGYLSKPATLRHVYGSWEYIVRDTSGREAIVRASRGISPVSRDAGFVPSRAVKHVFVFSPTGTYSAKRSSNVTELGYSDLVESRAASTDNQRLVRLTSPTARRWPGVQLGNRRLRSWMNVIPRVHRAEVGASETEARGEWSYISSAAWRASYIGSLL